MQHDDTTHAWWKEAVFYQIYPRSFQDSNGDGVGDLRGIIDRLDHLSELGVGGVWLSPMYRSPMVDHGYDISDYEDIDPQFGTLAEFDELLDSLHARDIKLLIDLVVNHTSDQHPWFQESRSSTDNQKRDWYIWRDPRDGAEPNNWASFFGGSAWTFDAATGQYYLHLFSPGQPDLNWRNPEVKEAVFAMIRRWIERGVDGFRVDVGHLYLKEPTLPDIMHATCEGDAPRYVPATAFSSHQPGLHELYQELRRDVLGPDIVLFGEMYELDPETALQYAASDRGEFNLVYQYPVVHARGDWTTVKASVRTWYETFAGRAWNTITFSNHDSPRSVSIFGDDRHCRTQSATCIATFLLTAPGTPFLLQGEELGMSNVTFPNITEYADAELIGFFNERVRAGADPDATLAQLAPWSRDNARTPMQWDTVHAAGFTSGTPWLPPNPNYPDVNRSRQVADPHSVFRYYQRLIALRREFPVLSYGSYEPLVPDEHALYAYVRRDTDHAILVVLNTCGTPFTPGEELRAGVAAAGTPGELMVGNTPNPPRAWDAEYGPWEARLYSLY